MPVICAHIHIYRYTRRNRVAHGAACLRARSVRHIGYGNRGVSCFATVSCSISSVLRRAAGPELGFNCFRTQCQWPNDNRNTRSRHSTTTGRQEFGVNCVPLNAMCMCACVSVTRTSPRVCIHVCMILLTGTQADANTAPVFSADRSLVSVSRAFSSAVVSPAV